MGHRDHYPPWSTQRPQQPCAGLLAGLGQVDGGVVQIIFRVEQNHFSVGFAQPAPFLAGHVGRSLMPCL